jgi:hypothetical protein
VPGNYSLVLVDSLSCSVTLPVEITQPDSISLGLASLDLNLGTAMLEISRGTPPFNIQSSNGQSGTVVDNLLDGQNEVHVNNAHDCEALLEFNGSIVNVADHGAFQLNLYPNPVSGDILTLKTNVGCTKIAIYHLDGELAMEQISGFENQTKIDVSNLSRGVYVLKATSTSGQQYHTSFTKINRWFFLLFAQGKCMGRFPFVLCEIIILTYKALIYCSVTTP